MTVKRSLTHSLARVLCGILLLSGLTTGMALLTLFSSLRDAETVNLAGALRMQSYRLAYELTTQAPQLDAHLRDYRHSLDAPALRHLNRFYVPSDVEQRYQVLRASWEKMDAAVRARQPDTYQRHLERYVAEINDFVLALQRNAERKLAMVAAISLVGFSAIIMLVVFSLRFIRRQVVAPLNKLVDASLAMQHGTFAFPPLQETLPNELGLLSATFQQMSGDLSRLYHSLEHKVQEKTARLMQANRALGVLFDCSQALSVGQLDRACFQRVLDIVRNSENLHCLRLTVLEGGGSWQLDSGIPQETLNWHSLAIVQDNHTVGQLDWQSEVPIPHPQLMDNVANMLGRGVFFNYAQKQQMQLLLMEERATIARELHDSLAQALSFLRIQLTLLKRALPDAPPPAQEIMSALDQGMADAYLQLRELLSTFRLTIQEASLEEALRQMLIPLQAQSEAEIRLDCALPSQSLSAQQQVHALQIVREAVLNAIKHANASVIDIKCHPYNDELNVITVHDNGTGIISTEEPEGHYGLTIMRERALKLGGNLTIRQALPRGTDVRLLFPQR
ncbi:nitrate/nitrite two-component system sensor histidine kinase NarQ [Chimaeribacter arupi]|uniref:nitrate/nitrite two-component system sensor histidine kinase NarQ n=1 Tax=Chimaeribacter arupi TaxID=2060066 RepID=UPI000C7AA311|nr:nitrate/nitrite two-component system sensor histidine kinase NarQ [Chimaeribacter arupi]PLR43099.1 nitrate/nitrite two-component system sensor histidine kinase NarQ [Chimaeribacter arupi]